MKINNKKFLEYIKENEISNTPAFIKSIRVNQKSISVKVVDSQFLFNNIFGKKSLYAMIISHLRNYGEIKDRDFLQWKYPFETFKVIEI